MNLSVCQFALTWTHVAVAVFVCEDKKFCFTLAYFLKGVEMFTSPAYKLKVSACFAPRRVNDPDHRQCTFKAVEWASK